MATVQQPAHTEPIHFFPGPGDHCRVNRGEVTPPPLPPLPPMAPVPLSGAGLYLAAALVALAGVAVLRWGAGWARTIIRCFDGNYDGTGWCGHDNLMPKGGYTQ